jgi:hypothetical protein
MARATYEITIDLSDLRTILPILAAIYRSSECPGYLKRRIARLGQRDGVTIDFVGGTILATASPEMLAILAVGRALRIY